MCIKNDLQKKNRIFYVKNTIEKSNTCKKIQKNYKGKSVKCFYIEILIFVLQNAINTSITKFCPGSTKWKTPFSGKFIGNIIIYLYHLKFFKNINIKIALNVEIEPKRSLSNSSATTMQPLNDHYVAI